MYLLEIKKNFIVQEDVGHWGNAENNQLKPATKEQCDLLFQKMYEAGYEWDAEKKELKLLITNGDDFFESENCEQKPSWSEEDEKNFDRICALIHSAAYKNYDVDEDGNECGEYANIKEWFKKLKDRVQPQITWKPNDTNTTSGTSNWPNYLKG